LNITVDGPADVRHARPAHPRDQHLDIAVTRS